MNIPKDHPWYGLDYDSDKLRETPAPGGLTFSGWFGDKDSWWIGFLTFSGWFGDKDSWWIGFDTAHSGDIWTGNETGSEELNLSWARLWSIDELMTETKMLADRVKDSYDRK